MSTSEQQIQVAFNPLIRPYLVLRIGFLMVMSIIGIPLALIWFLGVGQWWARHYFAKLQCTLDDKALRYRKGIIVEVEKTIPLENIQDVTFIEGPILRRFNLSMLRFETAGYSEHHAHAMSLIGIIDAHEFRTRIISTREQLRARSHTDLSQSGSMVGLEKRLDEIISLLKTHRAS